MDSYTSFAQVYDLFMDNVDYPAWCEYIKSLLKEYGISDGLVLDLGCGTGTVTELLADAGYDMIGVDNSCDMLEIAEEKKEKSGHDILYLMQDMREFELYGTVRAVVSVCDSVNYILEEEDLLEVFSLVNNYLDPGGMFIFDMNTRYKYEQMGDCTIAENREESSFIWDNFYDPEEDIYSNIFSQYEDIIIQSLITSFGLDFLLDKVGMIKDQHGGDVDTIHNVRQINGKDGPMQYKNKRNEEAYNNRGEYNYGDYHSDSRFKNKKSTIKARFDFLWCRQRDLNSRPTDYKSTAFVKYYLYKSMC